MLSPVWRQHRDTLTRFDESYMSTKATAARICEYGEPDVFRFETMDVPDPVGHGVSHQNVAADVCDDFAAGAKGHIERPGVFVSNLGDADAFTERYGHARTRCAGRGAQSDRRRGGASAISGAPRRYQDSP